MSLSKLLKETLLKPLQVAKYKLHQKFKSKDYENFAYSEEKMKEELESICEALHVDLQFKFIGYGAGVPRKFEDRRRKGPAHGDLDLGVFRGDKLIAQVEIKHSPTYTWAGSRIIHISAHDVKYAEELAEREPPIPSYCAFYTPLDGLFHWLDFKTMWLNYEHGYVLVTQPDGLKEWEDNYTMPPSIWYAGLEGLVKELLALIGPKQSDIGRFFKPQ